MAPKAKPAKFVFAVGTESIILAVVTWAMYGKNGFMGKLVSVFINCEKMVGPQFEHGLAELGKVVKEPAVVGSPPHGEC